MLITVSKKVCLFMMGRLFKIYFLVYRHETPEVAKRSNKRGGDDYSAAVSSSSSLAVPDASSTSSAIAVTEQLAR